MFALFTKRPINLKNDILSGLTVALALVPEAVAFSFIAGVDPVSGLYAAFFVGLITSVFGGRPGMISGATGATAVVMTAFVTIYGLQYLFAAVILAGLFQILAGVFRLGKFIRLLPHPVMLGFVNGLAIVIGLAQFGQFKTNHQILFNPDSQSFQVVGEWFSVSNPQLWTLAGLIVGTMLIIHFLPKLTRLIPASLAAIVLATLAVVFVPGMRDKTMTVADVVNQQRLLAADKDAKNERFQAIKSTLLVSDVEKIGKQIAAEPSRIDEATIPKGIQADLPTLALPSIGWDFHSINVIVVLALTLASIGLIESLMTLALIDELTETRGRGNRECVGLGLANATAGLFGGIGGCAMIGQSMININSGGRGRASGISAALFLLSFILFVPDLIGEIPIAALIGVMFMVVIATFEWSSLRLFGKVPKSDILVVIIVSALTVIFDLAIAVGVGIVVSALVYAWHSAKQLRLVRVDGDDTDGECVYELRGNLFFGSITSFKELFSPKDDPDRVVLDFKESKVCDHSGIEAIHGLSQKYQAMGKQLILKHLSLECSALLKKAGDLVEVNMIEDPRYHLADDELA